MPPRRTVTSSGGLPSANEAEPALMSEADESTTGPASFIAVDADRNPILVDQHL